MIEYILLAYLALYLGVAFVLPSYRVWKKTGVNPVTFGSADTAHDYVGKMFKVVMIGLSLIVILNAIIPAFATYLLPINYLQHPVIVYVGLGLLIVSLAWTIIAQIQMGNSWRIGIDEEKPTELVNSGLFALSRNPIFLGMTITLLGFFLAIPSGVTLLLLIMGFILIQVQVRLEEEFLLQKHGARYEDFKEHVRRWL